MTDQGEPRRSASDPIAAGVEAVAAGYRTVEYVIEAFTESLRRRPEAPVAAEAPAFRHQEEAAGRAGARGQGRTREGRGATGGGAAGGAGDGRSGAVPADLADLTAELFDRFGEAMHALADAIGERAPSERPPECPTIRLKGDPGTSQEVEFRFTNTGPAALREVAFEVTDLMGGVDRIDAGRVGTGLRGDERIPRVRPGGSTVATVTVEIPDDAQPGIYRGLISARPAAAAGRRATEGGPDAWALLELEVGARGRDRASVEEEGPGEGEGTASS